MDSSTVQYLTTLIVFCILHMFMFHSTMAIPINAKQKLIFEIFDFPQNETTFTCVPYHLCDSKSNKSVPLIDVRSSNRECPNYLEIPCEVPYSKLTEEYLKPLSASGNSNSLLKQQCGKRNTNGIDFKIIENGNESQFGEFPWMVAVLTNIWTAISGSQWMQCDGTLIHPQVVLTTAKCVNRLTPGEVKIRAGDWDTQTDNEPLPYQERDIEKIIIHEEFKNQPIQNNIALLVLKSAVNLDDHISTICLPTKDDIHVNQDCIAVGWGLNVIEDDNETKQHILRKYPTTTLLKNDCEKIYLRKQRASTVRHLPVVCSERTTNTNNKCWGKEGNILICPQSNGQYVQIGLKSSDANCMKGSQLFGSLNHFVDWIDIKMSTLNLDAEVSNFSINNNITLNSDAKGSGLSIHNSINLIVHTLYFFCFMLLFI